jgi:hypothetical protein
VNCFKPFKTTFKKERDNAMVINNHYKPNKCTLVVLVNKALDQSLFKKNIKNEFRDRKIWPFNAKALGHTIKPSGVYTTINI